MPIRHRPAPDTESVRSQRIVTRRQIVVGGSLATLSALFAACGDSDAKALPDSNGRRVALVYRGVASCEGCAEGVGSILAGHPFSFDVVYCGPKEATELTAQNLDRATMYVQPGGGNDLRLAWSQMRPYAADIRRWVRGGGHYVGVCLGGYLAGFDPGFGLLPGDSMEYITSPGATVHNIADTTVTVNWRGSPRQLYFQDGPYFALGPHASAKVLATYGNGLVAAAVARCGAGSVGVVGPHPEADASWYAEVGLEAPKEPSLDLMRDLITSTLSEARHS
ncbi:MAG TPA: BPL-N domain-containing protein [Acidimicrobiales bacterium]|jgi:glutamine amidotransferase-like uncharacterized protein|nr:BPL-N domain-containing protein [Acidimicrobiales bacterium]